MDASPADDFDDESCELCSGDRAARMKARHARGLQRLAEIGLNIADALEQCVLADPMAAGDMGEVTRAFSRVARAVRLTMALEARLEEGPPTHRVGGAS